jgi:hypothetical protein
LEQLWFLDPGEATTKEHKMNINRRSTKSGRKPLTQLKAFALLVTLPFLVAPVIYLTDAFAGGNDDESSLARTVIPNPKGVPPTKIATQREECTESADLRVLIFRDLSTIAFPRIPTTVSGTRSALVHTVCPTGRLETRLSSFAWKLETPPGSASRLINTNTLTVTFTPDRVGRYVVKLIACPNTCKVRLLTGHTPTNKPIHEDQDIGPVERVMNIDVAAEAQLPPLYNPPNLPSIAPATTPENYADPRSHCGGTIGIGIGDSPQWFTTKTWPTTATPPYDLAEGRVYHTLVSRKDHPASHNSNDANMLVELDPPFRRLLVNDTPEDKGALLPFGGLEVEWERDELPEPFRAVNGDRISALGFQVIDCGHDKYTEIHPPIAVAVHRPRAIVLPPRVRFQDTDSTSQPTGTNVVVPGIVTDLWINLDGGQALDCENASTHQPVFTTLPNGIKVHSTCVRQPTTAGVNFDFHIFLPPNPADRLKDIGLTLSVRPGLFFEVQNHPQAVALGASSSVNVTVLERHPDGPTPFVTVRVAMSGMRTGQKFAKRLVAAWVYPDHTGKNFGLRALRVRLNALAVQDDGDPFLKGDGDWRFWAVIPSVTRPWTRLIECEGCVEEKTYTPGSSVFRAGALDSTGALTGEVLLFDRQLGSFQLTGFEDDLLTSDDTGSVFEPINTVLASRTVLSKCNDQTIGGLNDIDPSTSGCAAYSVRFEVVPGRTLVTATLSPEMNRFAQQLLVRATDRDRMRDVLDTELYTLDRITTNRSKLTVDRRGDFDPWQLSTPQLKEQMSSGNPEPMIKDLRKHVLKELGPQPTEKHRRKIALELQELKKSVPPALYKKYLCDLETGKPCP